MGAYPFVCAIAHSAACNAASEELCAGAVPDEPKLRASCDKTQHTSVASLETADIIIILRLSCMEG